MIAHHLFGFVLTLRVGGKLAMISALSKQGARAEMGPDVREARNSGMKSRLQARLAAGLVVTLMASNPDLAAEGVKKDEIVTRENVSIRDKVGTKTVRYYRNQTEVMVVQTWDNPVRGRQGMVVLKDDTRTNAVVGYNQGKLSNDVRVECGAQPLHFLDLDGDGKWEVVHMLNDDFSLREAYRKSPLDMMAPFSASQFAKEKVAMQNEPLFRAESLAKKMEGVSVKTTPYTRDGKVVMVVQEGPFAEQGIEAIIFLQHDGVRASIPVRRGKMNGILVQPGSFVVSIEESGGVGVFGRIDILDDDMKYLEAYRPDGKGRLLPLTTKELNDLEVAREAKMKALMDKGRAMEAEKGAHPVPR